MELTRKSVRFDLNGGLNSLSLPEKISTSNLYTTPFCAHVHSQILWLAASAESGSEHPLAKAITSYYDTLEAEDLKPIVQPQSVEMVPGHGVKAVVGPRKVHVGNRRILASQKHSLADTVWCWS